MTTSPDESPFCAGDPVPPGAGEPQLPLTYDVTLDERGIRAVSLAGSMMAHTPVLLVILALCSACLAVAGRAWFAALVCLTYVAARAWSFLRVQKVLKQRLRETQGTVEMRYRITIDEDGVSCLNPLTDWHATFAWADVKRVGRAGELWVLETRGHQLIPVPRSAVPDAAWLKRKVAGER